MKKFTLSALALSALFLLAPIVSAQDQSLISNGDFSNDAQGWTYRYLRTQHQTPVFVEANPTLDITRALHAEVVPEENLKPYSMTMGQPLSGAIQSGDALKFSFWARSPQSNTLVALLGTVKPTPGTFFYKRVALTPEWKKYEFDGVGKSDLATGEALVEFQCALAPGTIELTGVEVVNVTATP